MLPTAIAMIACALALPSSALAADPPTNSTPPTISGTARQGEVLTADRGQWAGTEPIGYSYQWRRCATSGSPCVDIAGETDQTLRLSGADVGAAIAVAVTADNSALSGGGTATAASQSTSMVQSVPKPGGDPTVGAAGDIACDPASSSFHGGLGSPTACRQKYTSDLLVGGGYTAVLALGDLQYYCGGFNAFSAAYDPGWGRIKSITRPAVGNHEYYTTAQQPNGTDCDETGQAKGYFDYFNGAGNPSGPAGDRSTGYYSYDIGSWHFVVLNSECAIVACAKGSAQELWLKNDLATHPSGCTLAYWHRQESTPSKPFWADLYDAGADVVLNGHVHDYERFAPQNRTIATYDPVAGVRRFIVGTGGKDFQSFTSLPNFEVRNNDTYGVLKLTLHSTSYDWLFLPEAGKTFSDSGSAYCHKGLAASADLSLSKSDAPDPVPAGGLLTYTLTAQNQGPSSATDVTLTDTLPAGVTYDSATPSQGTCSESGGTVTCSLGALANGVSATVDVKVRPQSEGTITNQASVSSAVADSDSTNNAASADTTVSAAADLSLSKSDAPDPVRAGGLLTYTLTARNQGPSSAIGVSVTDTLPAGVTYDSATPSQGTCSESGGTVTCSLGALANGASATVDVKVRPQSEGTITNQASVSSAVADSDSTNNAASADTTVSAVTGYPRPKGASPLLTPLVPAYAECTSPQSNSSHGPPLASPSCTPPAQKSTYLTVGTPDANGAASNSIGSVRFTVQVNQSPTPNDVLIAVNLTDVRCRSVIGPCTSTNAVAGPDYGGQLTEQTSLRLTDKRNGPSGTEAGTVSDTPFQVEVPCGTTIDMSVGATCAQTTSANAVMPGSVQSGTRAIWELGPVQVFDGGPDGLAMTQDNLPFADQGVFVP